MKKDKPAKLSISNICYFTLVIFIWTSYIAQANHIIFENVGSMAGAISYIHAKITINISAVEEQWVSYRNHLEGFVDKLEEPSKDQWSTHYYETNLYKLEHQHYQTLTRVLNLYLTNSLEIQTDIHHLRSMMPSEPSRTSNIVEDRPPRVRTRRGIPTPLSLNTTRIGDQVKESGTDTATDFLKNQLKRPTRFLNFVSLGLGAYGTFLGLFNKKQISNLKNELQDVQQNHNRLVEVVHKHDKQLEELRNSIYLLSSQLLLHKAHDPGLLAAQLLRIELQLKARIQTIIHAFQQAQNHRLAVDAISAYQLRVLYTKLQDQAKEYDCSLLTENPSDLFQLEVSYFSDGKDLQIMVHVPMVPKDSMLRLFKLHPFPLPLSKDHFLLPAIKNDILAISSGTRRYSAQFTSADLLGCHQVNQVYLCERHGVLYKELNGTCLGSLYLQDFDTAQDLCEMDVVPANEVVYQLLRNWFLIFSPAAQTAPIECRNGTQSEFHIGPGISKLYLSPGCRANFQKHLLLSDLSIRLPTDILHFEWNWDPATLANLIPEDVSPLMQELESGGIVRPSLEDLRELKVQTVRSKNLWFHLVHFVGNAVVFGLLIGLIIFGSYKIHIFRQKKLSLISVAQTSIFKHRQPANNPTVTYKSADEFNPDQINIYPSVPERENSNNPLASNNPLLHPSF